MKESGLSRSEAAKFYEGMLSVAMTQLKENSEFTFPGFGVLKVTVRKAREGRNPRTGEKLMIPSRKGLKFKPYKDLTAMLNPPKAEACCGGDAPCEGGA